MREQGQDKGAKRSSREIEGSSEAEERKGNKKKAEDCHNQRNQAGTICSKAFHRVSQFTISANRVAFHGTVKIYQVDMDIHVLRLTVSIAASRRNIVGDVCRKAVPFREPGCFYQRKLHGK